MEQVLSGFAVSSMSPRGALPFYTNHLHVVNGSLFQETVQALLLRFNRETVTPDCDERAVGVKPSEINLVIVGTTESQAESFVRDRLRSKEQSSNIVCVGVNDRQAYRVHGRSVYGYIVVLPEVAMLAQHYLDNLLGVMRDVANSSLSKAHVHGYRSMMIMDTYTSHILMQTQLQWFMQTICSSEERGHMPGRGHFTHGDFNAETMVELTVAQVGFLCSRDVEVESARDSAGKLPANTKTAFFSNELEFMYRPGPLLMAASRLNDAGYNIIMASGLLAGMFWDCIRLDMDVYVSPVMKTCDGCASSGGIDRNVTKITLDDLLKYDFRR